MDKNYYKLYYYRERDHWWFKVRGEIIRAQIAALNLSKNCKILNVGAATYRSSEILSEFGEVTSLEYDKDCCQFVKEHLKKPIHNGSVLDLQFEDNEFDLVCAFDVIEHVEDDKLAVEEMTRVCKQDGLVFVTVPAYQFLWSEHDVINHHYRRYTLKNLLTTINVPKAKIVRKTYFNSLLLLPITTIRLISNLIGKKNKEPKSDLEKVDNNSKINLLFEKVFSFEKKLLSIMNFPAGVSMMVLFKK